MSRSLYKISLVNRGDEQAWRDFWERGGKGENPGRTDLIKARNLEQAIRLAQTEHPSCTVMRSGSNRIGSA